MNHAIHNNPIQTRELEYQQISLLDPDNPQEVLPPSDAAIVRLMTLRCWAAHQGRDPDTLAARIDYNRYAEEIEAPYAGKPLRRRYTDLVGPPPPRNLQTPIRAPRYRVLYLNEEGIERRTAWFHTRERAKRALAIVMRRFPEAVILRD